MNTTTNIIPLNTPVRIKQKEDNGVHQGQIGTLIHIDPSMDGDFYGVRFAEESTIYYFYRNDFEVQHG